MALAIPNFDAGLRKRPCPREVPELIGLKDDSDDDDGGEFEMVDANEGVDGEDGLDKTADGLYSYDFMLDRVFETLRRHNPELAGGRHQRSVLTVPVVSRNARKTSWSNFCRACKTMGRSEEHVMSYCLTELGTTGTLDGDRQFVIRGRFTPRHLENVLKKYIAEYVVCTTCESNDTTLKKENRLYFVQCNVCGSTRSVSSVRGGYIAQVGRRRRKRI